MVVAAPAKLESSRLKGTVVRVGLILFGLIVGLLASEVALRLIKKAPKGSEFNSINELRSSILKFEDGKEIKGAVTLGSIINPHPNDQLIYDLRQNIDVTFQGVPVKTNSCGMRNRETTLIKPPNTYRIAFLGDSFTFGWGVNEDLSFPSVLEKNLNRRSQGKLNFEVLNFGVPGYSTFQEVAHFKDMGADFDPDAVVVFFIENDFGLPFYIADIENPGKLLASSGLARLAEQAIGKQEKPRVLPHYDPNRALMELADFTSKRGIKLYLALNPKKAWKDMAKRLWVLRTRKDIRLINLRGDFVEAVRREGIKQEALTLKHDEHPSPIKHRLLADTMTPYFLYLIK